MLITDGDSNRGFIQKATTISNDKLKVEINSNGEFVVILE